MKGFYTGLFLDRESIFNSIIRGHGNWGSIEYGKCYRLISADTDLPLSNPIDYRTDREGLLWQFRVYHSAEDCSPAGTIKADEKFALNDVIGLPGDGLWLMCKVRCKHGICPGARSIGDSDKSNVRECVPFRLEEVSCLVKNPLPGGNAKANASFVDGELEGDENWNDEL